MVCDVTIEPYTALYSSLKNTVSSDMSALPHESFFMRAQENNFFPACGFWHEKSRTGFRPSGFCVKQPA
jgi:hypothetical protein